MPTTISSQVTGIAGFDVTGAVDGLLALKKLEITNLETRQTAETDKQAAFDQLNADLAAFRSTATAMADKSAFFSYGASLASSTATPASSIVGISGSSSVAAGQHTIAVTAIAKAERVSSSAAVTDSNGAAMTSDKTALGLSGHFTVAGATVTVNPTDSLQQVAANINQQNTGATATGVSASVIKVSSSDYRLVIASDTTGATGFALGGPDLIAGTGALAHLNIGALQSSTAVQNNAGTAITSASTQLNYTAGSMTINGSVINVGTTDTLQTIANSISAVAGVTATVNTAAAGDLRLDITIDSANPPANGIIAISGTSNFANLHLQDSSVSVLQAAADASLKIDGLTINRSSNTISDALSGVVLDLKQAPTDGAVVTMDISVDTATLQSNVQAFVDSYNTVKQNIDSQFVFDTATGTSGLLAGESLLTTIQAQLTDTLFKTVPGLASDRNSLAAIGVEPDKTGQLLINPARFDNLLNTDPTAIRDVFSASGAFTDNRFQFITNGTTTPSGTYPVNITTAATKASVTSTGIDLANTGVSGNDTITITDTSSLSQSVVTLNSGDKQAAIVSALNADFNNVITEVHTLTNNNIGDSSTLLTDLGTGMAANDTINITGNDRQGGTVNSSFTVGATDTVSTLLQAIQSAFNQGVIATVAAGKIIITDTQSGNSQLTFNITSAITPSPPPIFGQGAVTEGRFAMGLTVVASGTGITIESNNYGSKSAFSIAQTNADQGGNGVDFNYLGIANTNVVGVDVVGTIGGQTANGSGQLLMGNAGNADGVGILFTGTTAATNDLILSMGAAAQLDGKVQVFSDPFTGLIQNSILASQNSFDDFTTRIANLTTQMEQQRVTLTNSFSQMQTLMASFQKTGNFLSQLSGIQSARTG